MIEAPPLWQGRYRAPIVGFPTWSRHTPDRLVYTSSESGIYQLQLYLFLTGHAPFQIDERIHQTATVLEFLARHVPGIRVPS